jgi:hemerythrin superfamily protein
MYARIERDEDRNGLNWGALAGAAAVGLVAGLAANAGRKAAVQAISTGAAADWFEALRNEHRHVEKAFETLLRTGADERMKREMVFRSIKHALQKHAMEEENVIYPALRMSAMDGPARELFHDHADIKTGLLVLERMQADDPRWLEAARELQARVMEHVREEEEQIFPAFHAKMDKEENRQLSKLMHLEGAKAA